MPSKLVSLSRAKAQWPGHSLGGVCDAGWLGAGSAGGIKPNGALARAWLPSSIATRNISLLVMMSPDGRRSGMVSVVLQRPLESTTELASTSPIGWGRPSRTATCAPAP
jgi:hypothetical protein